MTRESGSVGLATREFLVGRLGLGGRPTGRRPVSAWVAARRASSASYFAFPSSDSNRALHSFSRRSRPSWRRRSSGSSSPRLSAPSNSSSRRSVAAASASIACTSASMDSRPRLAYRDALASILVPSKATTPTRTRPAAAHSLRTWMKQAERALLVCLAEPGDGAVVGDGVGRDHPEGDVLLAPALDPSARPLADAVGVEQQAHHHRGLERRGAPPILPVPHIDRRS